MASVADPTVPVTLDEIVRLASVSPELFESTFFPNTVRQPNAPFHHAVWEALDSRARLVNLRLFRGSAKTSKLRVYTAKRIAYGLAHTILYIGKSEGHAVRSINWIKKAVQHNPLFAGTFNLKPGAKWQDVEAEIQHGVDQYPIWIMGMGITGSVRGINRDDFRPDLIVLDDVQDEENSATPEQRQKIESLLYGAIIQSLAPASEAPDAKLAMAQTPLNREDISTKAMHDPAWVTVEQGCWTKSTKDLPLEKQESAWPARWTSEELRDMKRSYFKRNQASVWFREMECKLTSPETSAFLPTWLNYYETAPERSDMAVVLTIDPVPPPTEQEIAKGLHKKDYECLAVVGKSKTGTYLLEYSANRGHEPDWTLMEFFRLVQLWKPNKIIVEAIAYQATLSWLLKQAMRTRRVYYLIEERRDKRSKYSKIVDGLSHTASHGELYIREEHLDFIEQFLSYPDVSHDDVLEAVAVGVEELNDPKYTYMIGASGAPDLTPPPKRLTFRRGAP